MTVSKKGRAVMQKITFWFVVLTGFLSANEAYACCSYGCCDCSCVGAKLEKIAPKLDKQTRGGLQSFSVDASVGTPAKKASWKCEMKDKVASCEKQ